MLRNMIMYYVKLIIIFISICFVRRGNSQSHAFIQVDNEIRYLVDGVAVPMNEVLNGEHEQGFENLYDDRIISKNYLIFDPPFLDFKEHPTGMPLMKKVHVQNTSPDTSIHLHSLSGNTMHFHCTFFQDKVITPGGNTTFDVVFLGREEGFIENTIYVHTSVGTYRYWVKAVGTVNPYRIRPLISVRMPLNSSYTPVVQVHNPHNKNLQITEMYSTGGDLHLELEDSIQDADGQHWSILPYHTKTLMRATFVARRENNHTAYIRIVPKSPVTDYMVIPIEVEVSSEQGLFFPSDSLHFGLLTPHDPPVSIPLFLLNSAPKHIHIQNIITSTVNEAITIDFKPVKIPPGTVHPTQVATVTFDPSKVTSGVKVSGKLLVKSKIAAYKLSIPFSVDLYQGSLLYNSSVTRFYSGSDISLNSTIENIPSTSDIVDSSILDSPSLLASRPYSLSSSRMAFASASKSSSAPHDLILKNTFKFPVVVHNITVPDAALPHFKVHWEGPIIIKEDGSAKVAELSLLSDGSNLRFTVNITIHTNITSINIPLIAYNGKLTKYVSSSDNENWLDFGTLGMGEQHDNYFYILNENPVDIRLKGWGSTLSHSAVELMGIVEGNFSDISRNPNKSYSSKSLFLKPNHYAVFRIGILTPNSEGIFLAETYVQTQYEVIKLPFRLRTADGLLSIFPNTILLEDSFPGKISHQDIHILSTFGHSMTVEGISPQTLDQRFTYVPPDSYGPQPVLHPDHQSHIGKIIFDPQADCGESCYAGFSLYSKVGQQWTSTFALTSHAADLDVSLFSNFRHRYENVPNHSFNVSLLLDTSEVREHKFKAKVDLIWPRFVPVREINFPLTQVFNTTYKDLTIINPASQPVFAQVLFLHYYPMPQSLVPILQEQFGSMKNFSWEEGTENIQEVFSFLDLDSGVVCTTCGSNDGSQSLSFHDGHSIDSNLSSYYAQNRRSFESQFKTRVAKDSLPVYLESHSKTKVRLSFTPMDEKTFSTVIILRNNLTVVEAILLTGKGGRGHINFKKTLSKSISYFHFNVQDKNLKNCSSSSSSAEYPSMYTMRQTFLAENNGELPIHLYDFHIGDVPCQSYGFRVINCSGFSLQPNESHRIEIAFTPDFSLYHVEQFLIIKTSLTGIPLHASRKRENITIDPNGNIILRMMATVSSHAVAKCSDKIPRPPWEPLLYYSIITILVAMFVGTMIRAFLEAEHTLKTTFAGMTFVIPVDQEIPAFDKSKVFDLQAIAMQDTEVSLGNSTSGSLEDLKVSQNSYSKLKHVNSIESLKRVNNHNNNNNNNNFGNAITATSNLNSTSAINNYRNANISYSNCNKTKVGKLCNTSGFENLKNLDNTNNNINNNNNNNTTRRLSDHSKNDVKVPLGLSSFFTLSFGLRKHNSFNSSSSSSTKHTPKVRRNSHKETPSDHYYNSSPDVKMQNEEEFSSTTTESSSVDDIFVYLKDNYMTSYDEKPPRRKNLKSHTSNHVNNSSCSSSNSSNSNNTNNNNSSDIAFPVKVKSVEQKDTGFEITTKCKGIKKIKEMSSKKHSNTLELPYTLKPTKVVENDQDKANSKLKKNTSGEKNCSSSHFKRDDKALSEPGKRVPAKAVIAPSTRTLPQNQPLAPRDPSYSSIVLGNTKQKSKVTPVGKILPEIKRVEKPLGVIGQKLPSSSSGVFHSSLKSSLIGNMPLTSSAFPQQDPHSHSQGLYMSSLPPPPPTHIAAPQAVSSHSWDPKTLSSPSTIPVMGVVDTIRTPPAMSEEDWLPFGGPNFPSVWGDGDAGIRDKTSQNPPSPSLWESQSSFSIWSSPWNTDQSPLVSSPLLGSTNTLWQSQNPFDIGNRLPPLGSFESLTRNSQNKENESSNI